MAEVVIIEGPLAMVAADRIARAPGDLFDVMRRMVKNAHAGDASHKAADTALAAEREHVLYQAVKSFRSAVRDVLGTPD
ncbi:hypothetical protein ABWJ92_12645 [Streptomyces sp. NPDC000609]|uniref:hypothetical protein n=1 Tax=Streptomyces sp. NPDC000609 TaxID=3160957 RepID=UPI003394163A